MLNTFEGIKLSHAASKDDAAIVEVGLNRLQRWVENNGYRAYDPGDGQRSWLGGVVKGSMTLERLLTAAVLRAPFHVRPWLGIRPHISTKGMGYMASGYLSRYTSGVSSAAPRAAHCLAWLMENQASGQPHSCWGNDFTFTTRAGRIEKGVPTIVWSSLIGQAFVDAYLVLGQSQYLDVADSVCRWIMDLPFERTSSGLCLSYVSHHQVSIHNSNMLGAGLLARVGAIKERGEYLERAREAMKYSCTRQNDDGSWYYGEASRYHWIDNFHTGYNLDSLDHYQSNAKDTSFAAVIQNGLKYYESHFFERDGSPRYYHDRRLPVDIQCAAQSIDTLSRFSDRSESAQATAVLVARRTMDTMQSPEGWFYYRDLGWKKVKVPMFHWGQATMFKGLSGLLKQLQPIAPAPIRAAS